MIGNDSKHIKWGILGVSRDLEAKNLRSYMTQKKLLDRSFYFIILFPPIYHLLSSSYFKDLSPVGEFGIFTNRDQRSIFFVIFNFKNLYFWVLVIAAVFFGYKCCIFRCFIFSSVFSGLRFIHLVLYTVLPYNHIVPIFCYMNPVLRQYF